MKALHDPSAGIHQVVIKDFSKKEVVDRAFRMVERGGWESVHKTKSYSDGYGKQVYYKTMRRI